MAVTPITKCGALASRDIHKAESLEYSFSEFKFIEMREPMMSNGNRYRLELT